MIGGFVVKLALGKAHIGMSEKLMVIQGRVHDSTVKTPFELKSKETKL